MNLDTHYPRSLSPQILTITSDSISPQQHSERSPRRVLPSHKDHPSVLTLSWPPFSEQPSSFFNLLRNVLAGHSISTSSLCSTSYCCLLQQSLLHHQSFLSWACFARLTLTISWACLCWAYPYPFVCSCPKLLGLSHQHPHIYFPELLAITIEALTPRK